MDLITPIEHVEVVARFKDVYAKEKLSCEQTNNTFWFANEMTCAALVVLKPDKFRIKATVTRPEYRGQGYGAAMLNHLVEAAKIMSAGETTTIESFARNPKWYLNNGFNVQRVTPWGVTVVTKTVGGE